MSDDIIIPKKLIEVALPLNDINNAGAYEKLPGIGTHPRGIHHWWARRPLTVSRVILFSQLVNDPGGKRGYCPGKTKKQIELDRERLFNIIRELTNWKNSNNEEVLEKARIEIKKSWKKTCELNKGKPGFDPKIMPAFYDPFSGGGAIPLEAQRLGLKTYASDLNPIAVMITKAMIEIPSKFIEKKPIGPLPNGEEEPDMFQIWPGITGLAEDIRRYGHWMREKAIKKIGHLYPKVNITKKIVKNRPDLKKYEGKELTVIAWLWARTVKSPNPAFNHVHIPLVRSFILRSKKGKEYYVKPIIKNDTYHFEIKKGIPDKNEFRGTVNKKGAICLLSNTNISFEYIRKEGQNGNLKDRLMAIVLKGSKERIFIEPNNKIESIARVQIPEDVPNTNLPDKALGFRVQAYGMVKHKQLFTHRQLVALTTFSHLVLEAREKAIKDAKTSGIDDDGIRLKDGGGKATAYADALSVYLAFGVDRSADFNNNLTRWVPSNVKVMSLFNKHAIPMIWDFAESNILENVVGSFLTNIIYQSKCILKLYPTKSGKSIQKNAMSQNICVNKIVSTDPPYYNNIGYADLSDFFYIWMRRSLKHIYPTLFSTITVPKTEELVAIPYRHNSKAAAELFFLNEMTKAMQNLCNQSHPAFPVTIYYAFKQSETKDTKTISTGWETFLQAIIKAGFSINGTWPVRSEQTPRIISMGTNALASSIVIVCKKRPNTAAEITRREFTQELKSKMPESLEAMIGGTSGQSPIAPVDLAQAAIGPGMAIYSKYKAVLNQDGTHMSVHDALILINHEITEYLTPESGNFDSNTLWGELAYQLSGEEGFSLFSMADQTGTSPAKDTVIDLLTKASPCTILMDELVAFYRQFREGKNYPAGSFETNMTFIQVLTEAIKTVPNAILLASLPDSHNAGEGRGQIVLTQLENYFRRLQKIWKPVSKEEAFHIVRRRLIERIEDEKAVKEVCHTFTKYYINNQSCLPPETQESLYEQRMLASYPIHPEIFDRLYEDWSTLQGFQRTRGVLQFLAQVIHRLWKDGNSDFLIMPGNIPLYDSTVRNKALDYLPQGWDPVIDQDIDGEQSRPAYIESQEPRFGSLHAARKAARTIFLGSAPGLGKKQSKGISLEHIFLGCIQPGQTISLFDDVLKRLSDKLNYINVEKKQFWFEITPNLRREMESRKGRFTAKDDLYPLIKTYLSKEFRRGDLFSGIHIFADSGDIPDDIGQGLRLIILDPKSHYRKGAPELAFHAAEEILKHRGDKPRQYQNRLLFLCADSDSLTPLMDICKVHLSWKSIVTDINNDALVLDNLQIKNAKKYAEESEKHIYRMVRETYRLLICPEEVFKDNRPILDWEVTSLPAIGLSTMRDIENFIIENKQWVATKWGPQLLERHLNKWYFKEDRSEIDANLVWTDMAKYLYMPRLVNEAVFINTLLAGVQSEDFFAVAIGKEGENYKGFEFGSHGLFQLYDTMIIIEKKTAIKYQQKILGEKTKTKAKEYSSAKQDTEDLSVSKSPDSEIDTPGTHTQVENKKTRFYASINLNPLTAKVGFNTIFDEIIELFTIDPSSEVHISVEIVAKNKNGFDEQKQRAAKENCSVLKFDTFEFEE